MFGASKDLHDSVPSQKRSWQAFGESSGKGYPSFRAENSLLVRPFLSGCRWLFPVLFKPWPCRRGTTLNFAFPLDMRYFRHCMVVLCFQAFLLSFCSVFAEFPCYLLPDFCWFEGSAQTSLMQASTTSLPADISQKLGFREQKQWNL